MTEYRNDMVMRLIEEIGFLSARLAGLQAMGLNEDIFREVDRLEQEAGKLEPHNLASVRDRLDDLRRAAGLAV